MPSTPVSTASSGNNTVIGQPSITTAWIRVYEYVLKAAGTITVQFTDGTNALTGAMTIGTSEGVFEASDDYLFDLPMNTSLVLALGGNVQVSGHIRWGMMGDLDGNPESGYAGLAFDFSNSRNLILA